MTDAHGILALWNDCAEEGEVEYERWYMRQHLIERVGVPGFRFGRRYIRLEGDRKYFTFYETDSPHVLCSPGYQKRLDNPTDWTRRTMLCFHNTIRTVCRSVVSRGDILGGHAVTFRFVGQGKLSNLNEVKFKDEILPELLQRDDVCHVHLWVAAERQTPSRTEETEIRGEDEFLSWAVVVETTFAATATEIAHNSDLVDALQRFDRENYCSIGVYQFLCMMRA